MINKDNSCIGKTPYSTREKANEAVTHLNRLGGPRMQSYTCTVCGSCHVGHNGKQKKLVKNKGKHVDHTHEGGKHKINSKYFRG